MTLENQAILSNYEPLTALNATSKVWLVRDVTNSKIYVKKQVICESPSIYLQLQEASIDGIPTIYYVIESDDNEVVIIEEYIHGETVASIDMSYEAVLEMGLQVCKILESTHALSPPVICRDIKPSNIMCSNGKYYLTDFNIARSYEPGQSVDTHLLGTANYAAPEQYGFGQTDARTDIYSLGVTLNVLLTGKTPQEKLTDTNLETTITVATQLDPRRRFQTAKQMTENLKSVVELEAKQYNPKKELPSRLHRKSTWAAIIFYPLWIWFLITCVFYEGSTASSSISNWATRVFFFLVAFIPYLYNADYFNLLDYTLGTYVHGTIKYWLMRILFTLLLGVVIPFALVLFFV